MKIMAYKNSKITRHHVELVVRKAWTLFFIWEKSQHDLDYNLYLNQRELAERAIAAGHRDWQQEFKLP